MAPAHVITARNTAWVFLSGSEEPRHLDDLVFAVDSLRQRGVPDENVRVFTDHPRPASHLGPYGIERVFPIASLAAELSKLSGFRYVVTVVGGHGSHLGISTGSPPVLSPAALLAAVRGSGAAAGIVLLCQCYAGVFNFTDAGAKSFPLVLLGATNLNKSVSTTTTLPAPIRRIDGNDGLSEWSANVFMSQFFAWLRQPADIDGDGVVTVADGYRFAGVMANEQLQQVKQGLHVASATLVRQLAGLEHRLTELPPLSELLPRFLALQDELRAAPHPAKELELEALQEQLMVGLSRQAKEQALHQRLEVLYTHQEPWLLNASLAREIEIEL